MQSGLDPNGSSYLTHDKSKHGNMEQFKNSYRLDGEEENGSHTHTRTHTNTNSQGIKNLR